MTGQFFFTLLNPAVSAILAAIFLVLWRKRPDQIYLSLLALGFGCSGLAFAVNDFAQPFDAPVNRIAANLLFLVAVVSACVGALLRVNAAVPKVLFATACILGSIGFFWYLFGAPSTEARIYVVNATYFVIAASTVWTLVSKRPIRAFDWAFIALSTAMMLLTVFRPMATLFSLLDTNVGGSLRDSAYWATVQAVTPILAIAIGLAFMLNLAMKLFDELTAEANRDFLTNLLNRRGFEKGVQGLLTGRQADGCQACVIIVDIDNFKAINDSFGHAVGDNVIEAVAAVLTEHSKADLVARTGGDEFTLFYQGCRPDELLASADAMRRAMAGTDCSAIATGSAVTISMGLHSRQYGESIGDMTAAADRALYEAKRSGKDRAVLVPLPRRINPSSIEKPMSRRAKAS